MNLVFLSAACTNSFFSGQLPIQVYVEFIIANLIEPRMRKLILNHLIGNTNGFCNGLLNSYFFELTLRSDCLKLCYLAIVFETTLALKCYKNTSRFQTRALCTIRQYVVFKLNP